MISITHTCKRHSRTVLLFTDTDSFCYSIPQVENIYEIIKNSDWFDFSNFPKDHRNYIDANKMIPGKFKDESPENEILEFSKNHLLATL